MNVIILIWHRLSNLPAATAQVWKNSFIGGVDPGRFFLYGEGCTPFLRVIDDRSCILRCLPMEIANRKILLAEPEKAILDFWYMETGEWTRDRLCEMRLQNLHMIDRAKLLTIDHFRTALQT